MPGSGWRAVSGVLASLALLVVFGAPGAAAPVHTNAAANVLAGSPFRAIDGATCVRSPLDRVAIPVCYTASAHARLRIVMTRREYESIGGVGWGGTAGLSAQADGCQGRHLVTCGAAVSVARPELLTIVPGRQKNPLYETVMAYVYMDVARPPVPTQPLRLTPPAGNFAAVAKQAGGPAIAESTWVSDIRLIQRAQGLAPFRLPTNFYRLDSAEQLFVLVDLERTTRGLVPYFGLSAGAPYLAAIAQGGSPHLPAGAFDIAETGASDPARALFQWLYDSMSQPLSTCSRTDPGACPVAENVVLQHHDGLAGMFDPLFAYVAGPGAGAGTVRLAVGTAVHGATLSAVAARPLAYTWADAVAMGASPAR